MKIKSIRSFFMADRVRGLMVERKVGDLFDIDVSDRQNAEDCYLLLQSKKIVVVDPVYIPLSGKYTVKYAFSYLKGGVPRLCKPGDEVEFDQAQASEFLLSGHVAPLSEKQWTHRRLLGMNVDKEKVRRMYDDKIPEKDNWVRRPMRDENR